VKKGIAISCLVLLACATMLLASAKKTNVMTSADGKYAIATGGGTHIIPNAQPDTGTKISGVLSSYPYGTYFCCFGNTVAAGGANFPFQTWVAVGFTPASNATVTEIKASVGTFGENSSGFELALYNDNNGVPGTQLKGFHISSPPQYGTCCTLDVGKDNAGIPVTAGTQYWVVAKTDSKDVEFLGGWAFNSTDMRPGVYPIASWCKGSTTYCGQDSGKWVSGLNGDPVPAYSVVGNTN
jgi:hypothetical protein